jgi:choline dehydrogenase
MLVRVKAFCLGTIGYTVYPRLVRGSKSTIKSPSLVPYVVPIRVVLFSPSMKLHTLLLFPVLALASPLQSHCTPSRADANETKTYDYIFTGSGPGGGTLATNLARAGRSVLLVEAGSDATSDIRTQILSLNSNDNANVSWHFFVRHSDDEERAARYNLLVWRLRSAEYWVGRDPTTEGHVGAEKLGVFYPRGATLGGSAIINAAATFLPSESDWDVFDEGVGDGL